MGKVCSGGGNVSGHRLLQQLFDHNTMFRDTFLSPVLIDGHIGMGFSEQLFVEVQRFLRTTFGIPD